MNHELVPTEPRRRRVGRRQISGTAALVLVAGTLAWGPSSAASAPLSGGLPLGERPSVSGDGRFVVFEGELEGRRTVYRTDRATAQTVELSAVPAGLRSGHTVNPVISADGCVVVAHTEMPLDLFRDDDQGDRWDVYRLVVPECGGTPGQWELVSSDPTTGIGRDDVDTTAPAAVSGSGAIVAFTHPAPGLRDGVTTITVVDVTVPHGDPARYEPVVGLPVEAPDTVFRYRGPREPALSANGRHLAFVSDTTASDPLPGWGEGPTPGGPATSQVFVWDRANDDRFSRVQLVSGRNGTPSSEGAWEPRLSEDGRIVVFSSTDQFLVPAQYPRCDDACPAQVFRFDRDTDANGRFDEPSVRPQLALVSAVPDGDSFGGVIAGNGPSHSPSVNVDGSQVVFVTNATNLLPTWTPAGGEDSDGDILIAEVPFGTFRRVTQEATGRPVPGAHSSPAVSDTGRVVVFDTLVAGALTAGAPSGERHVVALGSRPQVSLASLDFGTVLVGWDSEELYVSVLNEGPGAFAPATVRSTSPNFRITEGGTCRKGLVVPAGGTCTVYVVFNPTAPALFTGLIEVAEEGHEAVTVGAGVSGVGGEPVLQANPPGLDLDVAVVGEAGTRRSIDIRNISFVPTSISVIRILGQHPDDFDVVGQSCTNRALNPGATCNVEIEFRPTGPNRRMASVQVITPTGGYTAAIIAGVGQYEGFLATASPTVTAGGILGVGVSGFPADSDVTLSFADAPRPFAVVRTNGEGGVLAEVLVPRRERAGNRVLIASGASGVTAVAPLEVRRPASSKPGVPGYGMGQLPG
jgi:Tol biopolymer transport system component